jgi:hypothetical protein
MALSNKDKWLRTSHGLERSEYDAILAAQDNRCAICENEFIKKPHVDHDHVAETIRGLLCFSCNFALGLLHDDLERIARMAEYVENPLFAIPRRTKRKDRSHYRDRRRERV